MTTTSNRSMVGSDPTTCVALLDDHPAVRAGVKAILAPQTDLHLAGCASNEAELWPMLERTEPIVAILDLHHPGRDGLALCLELKRRPNPPGVVLYSANTRPALVVAAAVAGADAIVGKSSPAAALVEAIRTVAGNRRTIPPITPRMRADAAAKLDPRDHAILAMRVADTPPAEIAATLGVPAARIARRIATIVARLEPLGSAA
jgi:DNA-binding NarL/FixJ family response regulator